MRVNFTHVVYDCGLSPESHFSLDYTTVYQSTLLFIDIELFTVWGSYQQCCFGEHVCTFLL